MDNIVKLIIKKCRLNDPPKIVHRSTDESDRLATALKRDAAWLNGFIYVDRKNKQKNKC